MCYSGFLFLVCTIFGLLSVVLCTRISVLVPGLTVFLVDYSLDYVLYSVHCLLDYLLCEFVHCLYCIAVYLFRYSYGVGLVLGFGVAALECM